MQIWCTVKRHRAYFHMFWWYFYHKLSSSINLTDASTAVWYDACGAPIVEKTRLEEHSGYSCSLHIAVLRDDWYLQCSKCVNKAINDVNICTKGWSHHFLPYRPTKVLALKLYWRLLLNSAHGCLVREYVTFSTFTECRFKDDTVQWAISWLARLNTVQLAYSLVATLFLHHLPYSCWKIVLGHTEINRMYTSVETSFNLVSHQICNSSKW